MLDPVRTAASRTTASASELRRLVASVGVSALGTWSYNVGIAVFAYQETGSTAWVAIATAGRYVPALVITSVGSRWADRLPRRTVAVNADLFCAAVMAVLTVVAVARGPIVLAIALAALSSGVARIQSAAALASAADVVPESRLARSASALSSTEAVATAVGPAIASMILTVASPGALFALNGATFLISAALVASISTMPRTPSRGRDDADTAASHEIEAVRRLVWPLLAARTVIAFVYGIDVVVLAVVATDQLRQGTGGYGWLLAAAGAGGLVAATWVASRGDSGREAMRVVIGGALYCLPLVVLAAAPALSGSIAVQVVRGAGCVLVTATVVAALQRMVPSRAAGRVFGLSHGLIMVGTSAGALAAPVAIGRLGLTSTLVLGGVLPFAVLLVMAPALRRFERTGAAAMAALEPRVAVLRELTLFTDASRSTLYAVADSIVEVPAAEGDEIIVQGQHSDALFILVSGAVEALTGPPDHRVPLRTMVAPDYFGEIGLVTGVTRTATVVATQPCDIWRIPAEAFLMAAGQAGLSGALTDGISVRLATAP